MFLHLFCQLPFLVDFFRLNFLIWFKIVSFFIGLLSKWSTTLNKCKIIDPLSIGFCSLHAHLNRRYSEIHDFFIRNVLSNNILLYERQSFKIIYFLRFVNVNQQFAKPITLYYCKFLFRFCFTFTYNKFTVTNILLQINCRHFSLNSIEYTSFGWISLMKILDKNNNKSSTDE